MRHTNSLFGHNSAQFIDAIDQLTLVTSKAGYSFMENDNFKSIMTKDPSCGMEIYWSEILARAHLTSVVAILRSRHWISAMVVAKNNKNLLAFAAAYRGLIESSADTMSALECVSITLAENHAKIERALSKTLGNEFIMNRELEDTLIHFKYARHLTKDEMATTPRSHKALQIRQYIECLEKGQVQEVVACYQSLCDLTHPGASSVWMWLTSENGVDFELKPNQDESMIDYYLEHYRDTFLKLLMFAFNPAILILKVLNYFSLRQFHTPDLLDWSLDSIPQWLKCKSKLGNALPRI